MTLTQKISGWFTGKGKLRTEVERENRAIRNTSLAILAVCGLVKGYNFWMQKQAERRAELGYDAQQKGIYSAPEDATNSIPNSPVQNPLERINLKNSATNPNMPFADNFDFIPGMEGNPITEDFIERIIEGESTNNPKAKSQKGARGLMQIMPETWEEQTKKLYGKPLPFSEAYDPEKNREVGTNYLRELHQGLSNRLLKYAALAEHEQQKHIAAAYNGGPSRLIRKKGDISRMPRETRSYVRRISR